MIPVARCALVLALALCQPALSQVFQRSGDLMRGRGDFPIVTLDDGKVLVTSGWRTPGGFGCPGRGSPDTTAETYNPATGTFTATNPMSVPRWEHSATKLNDGRVLITGGATGCVTSMTATAEIYDPATRTFAMTAGPMSTTRKAFPTAKLPDGRVLIFGGTQEGGGASATNAVERFNPSTRTFSIVGRLIEARGLHGICPLPSGRFLLMGGMNRFDDANPARNKSAEIYDSATNKSRLVASQMVYSHRFGVSAVALGDGRCLIASAGKSAIEVEVFDSATETFQAIVPPAGYSGGSTNHSSLTRLADGQVLLLPFPAMRFEASTNALELLPSIAGMPQGGGNAAALLDGRLLLASGSIPGIDEPIRSTFLFIPERTNGFCGAANGVARTNPPSTGLCAAGTVSVVSGAGPWAWTCGGSNGGGAASCSAPLASVVGRCGTAAGQTSSTVPVANLCAQGSASVVASLASWNWSCTGTSGPVSCWAPKALPTFAVKGRTTPGAAILLRKAPEYTVSVGPVVTDSMGRFTLAGLTEGEWLITATKAGFVQDCGAPLQSSICNVAVSRDQDIIVRLDPLSSANKPVLLVPGVMGSTLSHQFIKSYELSAPREFSELTAGVAPQLPKEKCSLPPNDCLMRDRLQIYDPMLIGSYGAVGSADLIDLLTAGGFSVHPAPWDWRESVERAYKIYLKPKIDDVKRRTGYSKVDIVAHSMGGLVARAYIQSAGYENDIDHLVMVGTPNAGSTHAYFLMRGGDPIGLDGTVASFFRDMFVQPAFYTAAVNELWRTYFDVDIVTLNDDSEVDLDSQYRESKADATAKIRTFLNTDVPGGNDLLPIYNFLRQGSPSEGIPEQNTGLNAFLPQLNGHPRTDRFVVPKAAGIRADQVRTALLLSMSEKSLFKLGYSTTGQSTYPEGVPNGRVTKEAGDGTVVWDHARSIFASTDMVCSGDWGKHPGLLRAARATILAVLKSNDCASAQSLQARADTALAPIISYSTKGAFALLLTAPSGATTGAGQGLGALPQEILNTTVHRSAEISVLKHENPPTGSYVLSVSVASNDVGAAPRIAINSFDPHLGPRQESVRLIATPVPYPISVAVTNGSELSVRIVPTVAPPTALRAWNSNGLTSLSWDVPADTSVTAYRVYGRAHGDIPFSLLGQTTTLPSFQTGVAWGPAQTPVTEFVVVSVNNVGLESLIHPGNTTFNVSYAQPSFTSAQADENGEVQSSTAPFTVDFWDQSTGTSPITAWAWDFDGDGTVDSTVANPSWTYQSPGTYAVTLRVTGADGSTGEAVKVDYVRVGGAGTPTFSIVVEKSGNGAGIVTSQAQGIACGASCSAFFNANSMVTLSAAPEPGSVFQGWGGDCSGMSSCQLSMTGSKSVYAIFGQGVPSITATPAVVAFGGQSIGTTSLPMTVNVSNTGAVPTQVTSVTAQAPFAITHDCGLLIVGGSCTVSITFSPDAEGAGSVTLLINTTSVTTSATLTGTGERSLVTHYYRSILRRAPDADGKAYWEGEAQRLAGLGANRNETWYSMANYFFFSPEYLGFGRDNAAFVTDLYMTFFNRAPDAGGLAFWTAQLSQGMPREVVLVGFMLSPEFIAFSENIFGKTTTRPEMDTVFDFYRGLLSRLPENAGLTHWLGRFRTAQCTSPQAVYDEVEGISRGFANSAEYLGRNRTNGQFVGDLYNSFLRRGGELSGVMYWINEIASGARSRDEVRRAFVAAPEFANRAAAILGAGCLN